MVFLLLESLDGTVKEVGTQSVKHGKKNSLRAFTTRCGVPKRSNSQIKKANAFNGEREEEDSPPLDGWKRRKKVCNGVKRRGQLCVEGGAHLFAQESISFGARRRR